jgi:hypothetical protein
LDQGSELPASLHDDFEDGNGVSRVLPPFDRVGDGANDVRTGHGTHVAGSVLGNGALSGSDPAASDYSNTSAYIGMAPQATLIIQALENNATGALSGIPSDLNTLFSEAYGAGARIHTNSWGASAAGNYTSFSEDVDEFVWNNPDFLILFSAGNDGVDANGDGVIDPMSLESPATAKNCITVGASENNRPTGSTPGPAYDFPWATGSWAVDYPAAPISADHVSDDAGGMAAFSSRGPCLDGRFKPDIVAPGTNVVSTKSSATTDTLWGQGPDLSGSNYTFSGGTSMATPLVAGTATLVRNFYTDLEGIWPSAALIKATLLNGAFEMSPGQYGTGATQEIAEPPRPSNVAGWGRIDLENSIFPTAPKNLKYEDEVGGLATNEGVAYDFTVSDDSEPMKATLVWSDYPGSPISFGGLVNDLDFSIIGPTGTVYYPNNADQGYETEIISYDDGIEDGGWTWTAGNRVGVRFTPTSYPATIDSAIFLVASSFYPNTFSYYVYNGSDAAGPQQILASGTTTIQSGGWHTVDLSHLALEITSGDFFLAIGLNANLAWFFDSDSPKGRSWDYANGTWTKWPTGNYMFRAGVVSGESITSYDRINNVLGIDIPSPVAGDYGLYVEGYNVPHGPQPYALVLSGGNLSDLTQWIPPISPADVIASAVSSSRIEISWADRSNAEFGFKIEKKVGSGGVYSEVDTVGPDVTNYDEMGQSDETSYYYRVRAFNAQGNSSYFNESNVKTHAPPSDLLAVAISKSRINLSWSDNSSNESGYEIWRRVAGNLNYSIVGTVAAGETSYADTNLSASTTYDYLVRAISTNSGSDFSNSDSATTLKSGGGGGGGMCFIAISANETAMREKIFGTLLAVGFVIICLAGLKKRSKIQFDNWAEKQNL